MEITEDIRPILSCKECNKLLSCGPVYFVHETSAAICGRCSFQTKHEENGEEEEKESSILKLYRSRNVQYEALAQLFIFPCSFVDHGCQEKMAFSSEQPNSHERRCPFRTFVCPIAETSSCKWIGSTDHLMKHCSEAHPEHVLENPCQLPRPNLNRSHLANYLISAFDFLFLVQLKVSLTFGQLCHGVRMFGETKVLDTFSYCLQIEGNNKTLIEKGAVLEQGLMMLQEPTAIFTPINNLLGFIGGHYEGTKFTLIIKSSVKLSCLNCLKDIVSNTQYCDTCLQKMVKCDFYLKDCLFADVNKLKCCKHMFFFCKFQTRCCFKICDVTFPAGKSIEHFSSLDSCIKTIKAKLNSIFSVTQTNSSALILLSSEQFGLIICEYKLENSFFEFWLYLTLPLCELKKLKCFVEIMDPQTNYRLIKAPQIQENDDHD